MSGRWVLAQQLGDPRAEREEVHGLAVLDPDRGGSRGATGFERALALARQLGDPAAEVDELRNLGSFIGQQWRAGAGAEDVHYRSAGNQRTTKRYLQYRRMLISSLPGSMSAMGNRAGAIAHYQRGAALLRAGAVAGCGGGARRAAQAGRGA